MSLEDFIIAIFSEIMEIIEFVFIFQKTHEATKDLQIIQILVIHLKFPIKNLK